MEGKLLPDGGKWSEEEGPGEERTSGHRSVSRAGLACPFRSQLGTRPTARTPSHTQVRWCPHMEAVGSWLVLCPPWGVAMRVGASKGPAESSPGHHRSVPGELLRCHTTTSGLLLCLHSTPVPHCLCGLGPLPEHSEARWGWPPTWQAARSSFVFNKGNPPSPVRQREMDCHVLGCKQPN